MKYTVAEFRKNMREVLDAVDRGAIVEIERYDKLYAITAITLPDAYLLSPETKELAKKELGVDPFKELSNAMAKVYEPVGAINVETNGRSVVEALADPKTKKTPVVSKPITRFCEHNYPIGQCLSKKKTKKCQL